MLKSTNYVSASAKKDGFRAKDHGKHRKYLKTEQGKSNHPNNMIENL